MFIYMLDTELGIMYKRDKKDCKYRIFCIISLFKFNHKFGIFPTKSIGE